MKPTGPPLNPEKHRWRGNSSGDVMKQPENLGDGRLEGETARNHPLPPPTSRLCSIVSLSYASMAALYRVCPMYGTQQVRVSGAVVRRDPLIAALPKRNPAQRTCSLCNVFFLSPVDREQYRGACVAINQRAEPGKLYPERPCLPFVIAWFKVRGRDAQPCRTMLMEKCPSSKTRRSTASRSKSGSDWC